MRSISPRFDPKLPLNQQVYHPQLPDASRPVKSFRKPPQLTLSTDTEIDHVLGPKTVPASVLNFPTGALESEEITYSSTEELKMLWETANGQRTRDLVGTLNLRMTKTGPATFTLGNSQNPLYTLQTFSTNEIALSRCDPSRPNHEVSIMMMSLEDRIRREHPNDGLVTLVFSRLAAMLAIDQAGEISKQHHLTPAETAEVETDALKRAAAQDSCRLSWDRHKRLYELRHPYLSRHNPPALVGAVGIPLSPVRSQSSGMVHITVSAPSGNTSLHQPPTIIVTGPVSSTAMEAAQQAANLRTSVLPVTDFEEPLASLDFATKTFSISPAGVIASIPSLYAIDSLIAALMAVAVSDEATNPILAEMVLGSPIISRPLTFDSPGPYSMPVLQGKLVTTAAECEDAAESKNLASQIESAQKISKEASGKKRVCKFWKKSSSKPLENPRGSKEIMKQQITVEEFDLEKYGRYGNGSSREGEKLPGITRTILRVLFFGFDLIVKGLALMVKVLAWFLVNSTRCVTGEKF
ncbi:putative proline-rich protein [Penicillium digitatum]|uniref:Putative proline-rich protein n=3 Tax=Penicillium digitatum TaxID=36651 RepID=K9GP03_PEND2|nr:putative proline-rich protein [Penicillium digitatum Pd1]EKV16413.1 putative proline-rich protein [Penicillium digitatum PHI26]EKV19511.1 putative proline-rich protein [Penicillium digitatum Pd1]QQK47280.1 putative proline-rich protein [Penicillium digitatum]